MGCGCKCVRGYVGGCGSVSVGAGMCLCGCGYCVGLCTARCEGVRVRVYLSEGVKGEGSCL